MNKLLVLGLAMIAALHGSEKVQMHSRFESTPSDAQVLISSFLIKTFPTNQLGLLEAGDKLNQLSRVNKKLNQAINSDAATVCFSDVACKHADVSYPVALGLLNTKGARSLFDRKKQFLIDGEVDCKNKFVDLVAFIAALEESEKFELLSQLAGARIIRQNLQSIYNETKIVRAEIDQEIERIRNQNGHKPDLRPYFGLGNVLRIDDTESIHYLSGLSANYYQSWSVKVAKDSVALVPKDLGLPFELINVDSSLFIKNESTKDIFFVGSLQPLKGYRGVTLVVSNMSRQGGPVYNQQYPDTNMQFVNAEWYKNSCFVQGFSQEVNEDRYYCLDDSFINVLMKISFNEDGLPVKLEIVKKDKVDQREDVSCMVINKDGLVLMGSAGKIALTYQIPNATLIRYPSRISVR